MMYFKLVCVLLKLDGSAYTWKRGKSSRNDFFVGGRGLPGVFQFSHQIGWAWNERINPKGPLPGLHPLKPPPASHSHFRHPHRRTLLRKVPGKADSNHSQNPVKVSWNTSAYNTPKAKPVVCENKAQVSFFRFDLSSVVYVWFFLSLTIFGL